MKIFLTIFLCLLLQTTEVIACSCSIGPTEQAYSSSKAVFVGTVKSIEWHRAENEYGDQKISVQMNVTENLKGMSKSYILDTAYNSVGCTGWWFEENETYLIYAFEEEQKLNVMWCGGITPQKSKKEFTKELGKLREVAKDS